MSIVKKKSLKKQERSSVKLTITVDKEDTKKAYDELIAKYSKSAQIKGFRKGKAPAAVLERKFGDDIKNETMMNILENSLKECLENAKEKPLPYSTPALADEDNINFNFDDDFTFAVTYDIYPKVEPGTYKELKLEVPSCSISAKDLDAELKTIQERNAIVREKHDGVIEKDSIVTINYSETDKDGQEIEGTKREDFVFTVGSENNIYRIDDDLIGMKKDEEKIIVKKYPKDYEVKEFADREISLRVKVSAVKIKELPKIDDELAQDVSDNFETLDDLKKDIKGKLETRLEEVLREKKIDGLMKQIVEATEIDIPKSMEEAELENSWRSFIMQSGANEESILKYLAVQGKTKESLFEEWRENVDKKIKSQLVIQALIEKEKIESGDEDMENEIKKQAEQSGKTYEEIKEYFEKNGLMPYLKSDIINNKLFDFLIENSKITKGKKMDFVDLLKKND